MIRQTSEWSVSDDDGEATVRADDGRVAVDFGCAARRFSPEDLRATVKAVRLVCESHEGVRLDLRDTSGEQFHVRIEDGRLFAGDRGGDVGDVPWDELRQALRMARKAVER